MAPRDRKGRLRLHRETLRRIDRAALGEVVGGTLAPGTLVLNQAVSGLDAIDPKSGAWTAEVTQGGCTAGR